MFSSICLVLLQGVWRVILFPSHRRRRGEGMLSRSTCHLRGSLTVRSSPEVSVISSKKPHPLLPLHEYHLLRLAILQTPMLAQLLHVQVASAGQPLLALLNRQRRHQPQARLLVREDPHHPRSTLYLLVETLEAVGGADASAVRLREGQASETLLDVLFEVLSYLGVALAPPGRQFGSEPQSHLPARCGEHPAQAFGKLLALGE